MNTMQVKSNTIQQTQKEIDKQINKLLAEATILLYEIKALTMKGVSAT